MRNKTVSAMTRHVILCILAAITLFPIIWLVMQSFKTPIDTIAMPPKLFFRPVLENYLATLQNSYFLVALRDSTIVAVSATLLALAIGTPFGYSLSRFRYRGQESLAFFVLCSQMIPGIVIIIPLLVTYRFLKLADTHQGLILGHLFLIISYVVWMTRTFFSGVPRELDDAARVDGCSLLGVFIRVILPLSAPGLVAGAIWSFLISWNNLLWALVLTSKNVTTVTTFMSTEYIGYYTVDWGGLSAAAVLVVLPTVTFIVVIQRHLVRGLTLGAVKG